MKSALRRRKVAFLLEELGWCPNQHVGFLFYVAFLVCLLVLTYTSFLHAHCEHVVLDATICISMIFRVNL